MTPSCLTEPRRALGILGAVLALGAAGATLAPAALAAPTDAQVCATVESDRVLIPAAAAQPDGADDAAIWINPADRSQSTFIGVDKLQNTGISVYNLAGHQIQFIPGGDTDRWNNDDLRYHFPLGGQPVTLLGATNRQKNQIDFWTVNEADGKLSPAGTVKISSAETGITVAHGFAMYHSPISGRYYAFVTYSGHVAQYELSGSTGSVTGKVVRAWYLSSKNATEGLVADDNRAVVYLSEETSGAATDPPDTGGIDRFGAEPGDSTTPLRVDSTTDNTSAYGPGHIEKDVKGLSMYYGAGGTGYLIAVSQGGDDYHVYDRQFNAGAANAWRGSFAVADCPQYGTDRVTATDGQDVTNVNLGGSFSTGMFVVQDDKDDAQPQQNYKMVPWGDIAGKLGLKVDTAFNPRSIGGGGADDAPVGDAAASPADTGAPPPAGPAAGGAAGAVLGNVAAGLPVTATPTTMVFGAKPGVKTTISTRKGLRATRSGRVRFGLVNANPFTVQASVTLESATGTRLAKTAKLAVGARRTVSLKLTSAARRLLKRGARKVELTLRLRDPQGNVRGMSVRFRLSRAR